MFKRACLVALSILFSTPLHAQLIKHNDATFGTNALALDFDLFRDGVDATNLFAKYGVHVSGKGSVPRVVHLALPQFQPPLGLVRNESSDGSSANRSLRVDFATPPRQLGFLLVNPGVLATITAYNADGVSLGTVQQVAGTDTPTPVRLTVPLGQGIAKIVIDYGNAAIPEQIGRLQIEHEQQQLFETFLPQVADGRLPDGNRLRTYITVVGLTPSTLTGDIRFLDNNGGPLLLDMADGQQATWKQLNPSTDNLTVTRGTSVPTKVGYAHITSRVPVTAVAAFQVTNENGVILSETSVLSSPARHTHSGPVAQTVSQAMVGGGGLAPRYETAIAIANAVWENNQVRIEVSGKAPVDLVLLPGEHRAFFLSEVFPDLVNQNFQGSIFISCTGPTVAVLLRTRDRVVTSSVPLDSLEP